MHSLDGTSLYVHFTAPSVEVETLLHCLRSFLVLAGQFSEDCSCDVLLGQYMAVHAHGYSGRGQESFMLQLSLQSTDFKIEICRKLNISLIFGVYISSEKVTSFERDKASVNINPKDPNKSSDDVGLLFGQSDFWCQNFYMKK